jgi:hypothetical protein
MPNTQQVRAILAEADAVAAIVGDRIHAQAAPDNSLRPYLTVNTIQGGGQPIVDGVPTGTWRVTVLELYAAADSYPVAESLGQAVAAAILAAYDAGTLADAEPVAYYDDPDADVSGTIFGVRQLWEVADGEGT